MCIILHKSDWNSNLAQHTSVTHNMGQIHKQSVRKHTQKKQDLITKSIFLAQNRKLQLFSVFSSKTTIVVLSCRNWSNIQIYSEEKLSLLTHYFGYVAASANTFRSVQIVKTFFHPDQGKQIPEMIKIIKHLRFFFF